MATKRTFRPQNLRNILLTLLIIIIIGGGIMFYFGLNFIRDYSVEVDHRLADAAASARQIEDLQSLKSELAQSDSLVTKADRLFSSPQTYQSQALTDIENYADAAGLSVTNTSFSDPGQNNEYTISITLNQPVTYTSLIHFLENIESSLPKMQINSIALGRTGDGRPNSVKTDEIKINISVR